MSYQIPYIKSQAFKIQDALIPNNSTVENPVEFDLVQAWGADLARIRSIMVGSIGLVNDMDWSPAVQQSVIGSFDSGAAAFVNTVKAVRGLTVPAEVAQRAGLILELPVKAGTRTPDPDAPFAIKDGAAFAKVCGAPALLPIALAVTFEISKISRAAADLDNRFFVQPSGSGGTGTQSTGPTTAGPARTTSRRRATADSGGKTGA